MSRFFDLDSTRATHQEYWWGNKSPLVIIGWMLKWVRIRIPGSADDPNVDSTLPFVTESLPADVDASFQVLAVELAGLGFHSPVNHVIYDPSTDTTICWATYLHSSGKHFVRIHRRMSPKLPRLSRAVFPIFFTEFGDGTFRVSSSGKPDVLAPESVRMNRMHGAPLDELWAAHQRFADADGESRNVSPVRSREELIAAIERHHVLVRDFHLARGFFRERSIEAQAKADVFMAKVAEARSQGLEHAEVLVELDRLQNEKVRWSSTIWILIISAVAFLLIGSAQWNWKFTLILIPVLLFHETGHWIAMRLFGYRNLRMFFIPFFGAAVTGRHFNVAGWKKALVSLAGPLPGIVLGVVLGIVGMVTKRSWTLEASMLLLTLNGFNLLPILPLDGGHVLHATLFCRNRWLDVVFRGLAIAGLAGLGILGGGKLLIYIAISLAIGLPLAFKLARITDDLRRQSFPPPLPNELDRIPTPVAQTIISAVKSALPQRTSNRMTAKHVMGVFETLNSRPPGVLATIALLIVHGGAMILALVFGVLLVLQKQGGFSDFLKAAARQPTHNATCENNARSWPADAENNVASAEAKPASDARDTIVVTFPSASDASKVFGDLTRELPAGLRLVCFGESVLMSIPSGDDVVRERWFDRMQLLSTNTFICVSNRPVNASFTFLVDTEAAATNFYLDLHDFFQCYVPRAGECYLIPPWSPEAAGPGFEKWRHARREWQRIDEETSVWKDPALADLQKRISAALRRGSTAEADRLGAERLRMAKELRQKNIQKLRAQSAGGVMPQLLDLHEQLEEVSYTNRVERAVISRKVAALLGEVARENNGSQPTADAYGAQTGLVVRHGLLIEVRWMMFSDALVGAPAFVEWLCRGKCRHIRYEFEGGFAFGPDEDAMP